MAPQSRAYPILLTRPAAQSARFAMALQQRFVGVNILIAPLIEAVFLQPFVARRDWAGVIFTSETGAMSARRIATDGTALPELAFCVGDQTARMASDLGFRTVSAQGDGLALAAMIKAQGGAGPFLYLHGAHVRVDLGDILNSAGIETVSAVSYDQTAQPLTPEAVQILQGEGPVITPVFSARTGQLLAAEYGRVGAMAPLFALGISADVVGDLPTVQRLIAERPDAGAMLLAMDHWLA